MYSAARLQAFLWLVRGRQLSRLKNYSHGFASDFPRLSHIYEGGTEENPRDSRRVYPIEEILKTVKTKLLQGPSNKGGRGLFRMLRKNGSGLGAH